MMSEYATTSRPTLDRSQNEPHADGPHAGDLQPTTDLVDYVKEYAREKPEVAALWCLGVGFILGWKLKPW